MIPHSIRLRQPWDEVPAEAGRTIYRRRFNRPTGLDAWERVSLEIDRAVVIGTVSLNGALLGQVVPGQLFTADITPHLQLANELRVEADPQTALASPPPSNSVYIVDPTEPLGSPIGDVRLVIRAVHPGPK
jgi:hypothetical protein